MSYSQGIISPHEASQQAMVCMWSYQLNIIQTPDYNLMSITDIVHIAIKVIELCHLLGHDSACFSMKYNYYTCNIKCI